MRGVHFVTVLSASRSPELLATPLESSRVLEEVPGTRALACEVPLVGKGAAHALRQKAGQNPAHNQPRWLERPRGDRCLPRPLQRRGDLPQHEEHALPLLPARAWHWTDRKLRVHAFYCMLALTLATLAHKVVTEAGIDLSLPAVLKELSAIREVAIIYHTCSSRPLPEPIQCPYNLTNPVSMMNIRLMFSPLAPGTYAFFPFSPGWACFSMPFNVPGARSSLPCPAVVTLPFGIKMSGHPPQLGPVSLISISRRYLLFTFSISVRGISSRKTTFLGIAYFATLLER